MVGWNSVLNEAKRCADCYWRPNFVGEFETTLQAIWAPHLEAVLQKTDHICGETPVYSQASTAQTLVTALTKELIFIHSATD